MAAQQQQSIFAATIARFMAHALNTGYLSEPGYQQMGVDRRIRFEYSMCGRENF